MAKSAAEREAEAFLNGLSAFPTKQEVAAFRALSKKWHKAGDSSPAAIRERVATGDIESGESSPVADVLFSMFLRGKVSDSQYRALVG